jgi:hypothetical protein
MPLYIPSRRFFTLFDETQTQSASTAVVNSATQITLPIGTYTYEGESGGSTASSTGGVQVETTMPTGFSINANTLAYKGTSFFGSTIQGSNTRVDTNSQFFVSITVDASGTDKFVRARLAGIIKITAGTTFGFKIAQRTATDASNPATLMVRSYLNFSKIA